MNKTFSEKLTLILAEHAIDDGFSTTEAHKAIMDAVRELVPEPKPEWRTINGIPTIMFKFGEKYNIDNDAIGFNAMREEILKRMGE